MAKTKIRYMDINVKEGNFVSRVITSDKNYNFSDITLLRKLLSNEKSRILYTIKRKNPKSIYSLAKILGRDFKSVREDTKVLEKFGFIEFKRTEKGKREALMPVLAVDSIKIILSI